MLNQQELLDKVKVYNNYIDENVVKKAYDFALDVHKNQKRLSGDPYISHPIAVAAILCDLKVDTATIITALLHDTIEDTEATYNEVNKLFGKDLGNVMAACPGVLFVVDPLILAMWGLMLIPFVLGYIFLSILIFIVDFIKKHL